MAVAACTEGEMCFLLALSVFSIFTPCSSEKSRYSNPAIVPSGAIEFQALSPRAPMLAPAYSQKIYGPAASPIHKRSPHATPSTFRPPQENCERMACSGSLTRTPIGSPCGCVFPITIVIDLGLAPVLLFPQMAELEIEVAAGTHLKQSQVRIMGADASIHGQDKTTVTIYLVPLGDKFDKMTALLIYDWFWKKKIQINASIFGEYEAIVIRYPGLPSSPPSLTQGSSVMSPTASQQFPLTAKVPTIRKQNIDIRVIVLVALSTLLLMSLCIGVVLIIFKLKKLGRSLASSGSVVSPSMTKTSGALSMIPSSVVSSTAPSISAMATYHPSAKTFSLAELEKATDGFCSERLLGEGGFGYVYHGILDDQNEVAVKLLRRDKQNGDEELIREVQLLSRLHHRNLIKLVGLCIEEYSQGLVYELVRNGSVESHLHGADRDQRPLDWNARMKIALGAARALAYLHEDSDPCIIHRDFKASNILLEEDYTPKVSDFGLAKEACNSSHHISTRVMGTFGYVAPEYAMTGHLLVKSDVYSYGVVLLELLTGRKPVYMTGDGEPENLVTWARPLLTSANGLHQLMDPLLRENCSFDEFARIAAVASMCVHIEASQRPFMGEVVQALKLIYSDSNETNEASNSPSREFGLESNWWSEGSPRRDYWETMGYSPDGVMEEIRRPHSTSSLVRWAASVVRSNNGSGPLRSKSKKMVALHGLRGTMSEHGIYRRQFIHMN